LHYGRKIEAATRKGEPKGEREGTADTKLTNDGKKSKRGQGKIIFTVGVA